MNFPSAVRLHHLSAPVVFLSILSCSTAVANLGVESNTDKLAGTDPAFVLAGLVYALCEEFDLDFGVKYGLNDPETDRTVLAGVTWKF